MNRYQRLAVTLWAFWSSDAGAYTGGGVGVLASLGVWTGQLPVPDSVPTWLAMILSGVPLALSWLATRVLPSLAAAARAVASNSQKRIARLEAMSPDKQPDNFEAIIVTLEDRRDYADALAAGLEAWKQPKTGTEQ